MKKALLLIIVAAAALVGLCLLIGCDRDVNSIQDPHFDADGAPLDSAITFFEPQTPEAVRLYIETSGSMNGFFRANCPNRFKKTVWSVFSGLEPLAGGLVSTMSNGGDIDAPIKLTDFRVKMNAGAFVSNTSTHIPAMLYNILQSADTARNEVAVLVSDMKYSPVGRSAATELNQYQEQIRNTLAMFPGMAVSFVCAMSEYLATNGSVVQGQSPYYFIIVGPSANVAEIRNDIAHWCEFTDSYVESGDMGMSYLTPSYEIDSVSNGLVSAIYPKSLITDFSRALSDTCSFVVRVDMTGFPWRAMTADALGKCLRATATYGSTVDAELLGGDGHLVDDHAYKRLFQRVAYADFLVKVYNFVFDDEVVEWTFSNQPLDDISYTAGFRNIINAQDENDLSGTFSFNQFIAGCYNARLNTCREEPVRILISSKQ